VNPVNRCFYYNRQGRPISSEQWTADFAATDRRVLYTDLGRRGRVSTVWLGIDHAYDGPPMIFETLVFDGPLEGEMYRYSTEEEARIGHEFMLMRLSTLSGEWKHAPLIHNGKKPRR
jgi:hypothetical protein